MLEEFANIRRSNIMEKSDQLLGFVRFLTIGLPIDTDKLRMKPYQYAN